MTTCLRQIGGQIFNILDLVLGFRTRIYWSHEYGLDIQTNLASGLHVIGFGLCLRIGPICQGYSLSSVLVQDLGNTLQNLVSGLGFEINFFQSFDFVLGMWEMFFRTLSRGLRSLTYTSNGPGSLTQ